ncbi:MAG: hypothetical protein A3A33_04280 [Candidatus Yanofskybacteria bacterium RIFCSPLOWO2_01_FULL_49_25]|uniref:Uncharacterized protein n=1 Tax=Candidatus Yanofskybacteria bacterium RIFCSPLOWO2_01_FULL_49_25 TaxID=1802701 RepID=A0A1F8GR77_9BACT|nr:MAG: hypothetical protein A3A33_04280 [Candidatus Yanofskybacteria bacterium RIFCSPLOWO2_01_FULL_49_25]
MSSFLSVPNIVLIAVVFALGFYSILAFITLYHLIRFGIGTAPKVAALIFFAGSIVFVLIVIAMYIRFDYNALIAVFT